MRAAIAVVLLAALTSLGAAAAGTGWFIGMKDHAVGPLTAADVEKAIQHGEADAKTLAWEEGMADWKPLGEIPRFRALFDAPAPGSGPPPLPSTRSSSASRPPPLPPRPPLVLTPPPLPAIAPPPPLPTASRVITPAAAPAATPTPDATPTATPAVAAAATTATSSKATAATTKPEARWYYADGGAKRGPVLAGALAGLVRDKHIERATLVWTPGMKEWRAAGDVDALRALLGGAQ